VAELRYKKTVQTVADMQLGQKAWIKAEAMYADAERKLWLKRDARIEPKADATAAILVERAQTGYTVDITQAAKKKFATVSKPGKADVPVEKLVY